MSERIFVWTPDIVLDSTTENGKSIVRAGGPRETKIIFMSDSPEPFEFVSTDKCVYFANGKDARKWDGISESTEAWGNL